MRDRVSQTPYRCIAVGREAIDQYAVSDYPPRAVKWIPDASYTLIQTLHRLGHSLLLLSASIPQEIRFL